MVEFDCSKCWSLTTGSVEEEGFSSSDRCARPRAAKELPRSVTVGQLADARTETGVWLDVRWLQDAVAFDRA